MLDPATEQVRLFLRAKRPRSALVVAILRGFPWWRFGGLIAVVAGLLHR